MTVDWRRHEALALSLGCGFFLTATWIASRGGLLSPPMAVAGYLVAYALGAYDILRLGFRNLVNGRVAFDIDLLDDVGGLAIARKLGAFGAPFGSFGRRLFALLGLGIGVLRFYLRPRSTRPAVV